LPAAARARVTVLKNVVQTVCKCRACHLRSVLVTVMLDQGEIWTGVVEEFAIIGHLEALWCYAWMNRRGETLRPMVVLDLPPVTSPHSAVHVTLEATRPEWENAGRRHEHPIDETPLWWEHKVA
jgi:hypothetical protein